MSVDDFLKRFDPIRFQEKMKTFANATAATVGLGATAVPSIVPGKIKGKGKLEQPENAEVPELKEMYADVIAVNRDFVPSTKIHRIMSIIEQVGKYNNDIDMCCGFIKKCLILETNHPAEKIIVFSQFTSFLNIVEIPLLVRSIHFQRYDGTMNGGQRRNAINLFRNDPDCKVILVSLKSGSLGLNLSAANHVIMCDLWWNPAVENQSIDRAHRMGQVVLKKGDKNHC